MPPCQIPLPQVKRKKVCRFYTPGRSARTVCGLKPAGCPKSYLDSFTEKWKEYEIEEYIRNTCTNDPHECSGYLEYS